MKVLILLVFCLSVMGCGRRGERIHNIRDLDQDQLNIVNNQFDIDIIAVDLNTRSRRNIKPICKAIDGCLKVCDYFNNPKCTQLSIDKVLAFWLNQINEYSKWEQARNDLNLIATQPKVSDFLSNVDKDNQVVEALFNLSIAANCPISEQPNILFSYTPHVSLYLGAPKADAGAETEVKVLCKAAYNLMPDGSHEMKGDPWITQENINDCLGLARRQVVEAKKTAEAAEAEVAAAQEALGTEEAELAALKAKGAEATQEEMDAAEAKVASAKEALAAAEGKLAEAQEAVQVAEEQLAAEVAEEEEADMKVDCTPGIDFSPAGSEAAEAAALAAQEKAKKCPGLEYVEFSGDGGADEAEANKPAAAGDSADGAAADAEAADQPAADTDADREVAAADDDSQEDMPQKQMPVSTKKKIMDGQVLYFNLPVFAGYIKKCFGFDSKTFSEMALEIENKTAFELGDKVISKACSENSECIRLSYCAIDSELVWKNLKSSITEAGCDYEGFSEMLP